MKTVSDEIHNARCAAQHIAPWLVEPIWFNNALASVKAGVWQPQPMATKIVAEGGGDAPRRTLYEVDDGGLAFIVIDGPMMKGDSKFGGTSMLRTRRALRLAATDSDVRSILMVIDSPGGTVAGTQQLADDVRRINATTPIYAHIEDLGASAAYWVASQARQITANETADVGSIGVLAIVEDTSGAAEMAGVKIHVVSTGDYKGAFADGAEVTEEHLTYLRDRVDNIHDHFVRAIMRGRDVSRSVVNASADGRTFSAADAKQRQLIDRVASMDDVVDAIHRRHTPRKRERARMSAAHRERILQNNLTRR